MSMVAVPLVGFEADLARPDLELMPEGLVEWRARAGRAVIDMGRRSRLFSGAAREALMLLPDQCGRIGCAAFGSSEMRLWCGAPSPPTAPKSRDAGPALRVG
jgi:hypothetical protein